MKTYLIPVLALASLLHAQEMSPQLRQDISTFQGRIFAEHILQMQENLGSSFHTEEFISQLEEALKQPAISEPKSLSERMVAGLRREWERRDVDDAELMLSLRRSLRELPGLDDEVRRSTYERRAKKIMQQTTPVLQAREAAKEKRVLELNARREGVVILPNGVQMEVKPGAECIRRVNRIMTEEGLSYTERVTTECSIDDLPPSVARMMQHIPDGAAWTFWIPAEVTDRIANGGQDTESENARREALMDLLSNGSRQESFEAGVTRIRRQNNAEDEMPKPRTRLLKLTVWHDEEEAPIRPFGE